MFPVSGWGGECACGLDPRLPPHAGRHHHQTGQGPHQPITALNWNQLANRSLWLNSFCQWQLFAGFFLSQSQLWAEVSKPITALMKFSKAIYFIKTHLPRCTTKIKCFISFLVISLNLSDFDFYFLKHPKHVEEFKNFSSRKVAMVQQTVISCRFLN